MALMLMGALTAHCDADRGQETGVIFPAARMNRNRRFSLAVRAENGGGEDPVIFAFDFRDIPEFGNCPGFRTPSFRFQIPW